MLLALGPATAQGLRAGAAMWGAAPWQAGTARAKITPQEPMWMAGYAGRPRPARDKIHDLWAKALVLQDDEGMRVVLVTLDVTGIDRRFSLAVREELKERYGLERKQIALCSSHTHSGPVTSDRFAFVFGLSDRYNRLRLQFLAQLRKTIVRIVGDALGRLVPCRLFAGTGTTAFAFNRRNNREGDVVRLRGQGVLRGPMDLDVPVLAVRTADDHGRLLAVAFGYACHCTTLGPPNLKWCGDYAGFAQVDLERAHPGCTALFWAGCGGDQNPGPRRNLRHALDHGRELANAVLAVLSAKTGEMTPIGSGLGTSYREVEVPFARVPTLAQLQKEAANPKLPGMARRAKFILDQVQRGYPLRSTYPYPVQVWQLGTDLLFVTLGGEAVVDYALRIKKEFGAARTWVASYANDVMAYIPSLRVLREGGYEGRTSMMVYGLPAPWGPQIEPLILHSLRNQVRELGGRPSAPATGTALDFEDSAGVLNDSLWYVGGGMNATRLRTGTRAHESSWALSTAGDSDYPTFTSNISQSRIDANTSVAWGPFFTLREKLPAGARISLRIAGGSKAWGDGRTDGPTGFALWDVANADFARNKSGQPIYVACETNGFDFEAASVRLAGLERRTLGLVLVDRATQSWAWSSIDDVVISEGCYTFSENHHHQVTIIGEFDTASGLAGWTGDQKNFRLHHAAPGRALFINRRVRGTRYTFPENAGYLSSSGGAGDGATGTLRSPDFTLDGHILEFYLAGDGGADVRFELVSAQGKVLTSTSPDSGPFAYHFWRIEKGWREQRAHVRLVDKSTDGRIDVDAIRMVQFDVKKTEPKPEKRQKVERSKPPTRKRKVAAKPAPLAGQHHRDGPRLRPQRGSRAREEVHRARPGRHPQDRSLPRGEDGDRRDVEAVPGLARPRVEVS